jgi:hypothetical protein
MDTNYTASMEVFAEHEEFARVQKIHADMRAFQRDGY